jgi:N-acetylneuraminate synthase
MDRVFIIAEAGVNHNGSIEMARKLIDVAAEAGADAVKFQTFKAESVTSRHAPKAEYQLQTTDAGESQLDMIRKLELSEAAHRELIAYANSAGIEFLSTPFDSGSLAFLLDELNLSTIKIPSGEITNAPFLLEISRRAERVILSTGMSTLGEVEMALGVLAFGFSGQTVPPSIGTFEEAYRCAMEQNALHGRVTLLHCTTEYPAPFDEVNLRAMGTLQQAFGLPVGYSDHTPGIAIPVAAVAMGARMIEKHFTLDRNLPGPDHKASLEPDELKKMVQSIREVGLALGSPVKRPTAAELKNKLVARKSLVAACDIQAGEPFTPENLLAKRPDNGVSPIHYWEYLGRLADKDYCQDDRVMF